MKNRDNWRPSKYVYEKGKLRASRDSKEVGVASRLIANLVAECYDVHLCKYATGRLLDLGCGKVPLFATYKEHVREVICVDWGNSLHGSQHLDFECDLTKPLPFRDGEFDTIILSDVLEHIPEPELLWKEMSRMLSTGGHIMMNVPFYYWIHESPHDYYRYTEYALRRFVGGADLSLVELVSIGGAPEIMTDIFAKNVRRLPLVGDLFAGVAQALTFRFVKTRFGKRISAATSDAFPLGYFLIAAKTS